MTNRLPTVEELDVAIYNGLHHDTDTTAFANGLHYLGVFKTLLELEEELHALVKSGAPGKIDLIRARAEVFRKKVEADVDKPFGFESETPLARMAAMVVNKALFGVWVLLGDDKACPRCN